MLYRLFSHDAAYFIITFEYSFIALLQLLISVLVNWCICGVLTSTGMLTDDPENIQYETRTDARIKVIADSPWFNIPYPGKYHNNYM